MKNSSCQQGYIALVGVLLLGSAILVALLALSLGVGIGTKITRQKITSEKSYFLALACAEEALEKLWEDEGYLGNEILSQEQGLCGILPLEEVGGKKIIRTYGILAEHTRRMEIVVGTTTPQIIIDRWEDVGEF